MNAIEKKTPDLCELRTIAQLAKEAPAFSEARLRWIVFNAEKFGVEPAIVRAGRNVFIWPSKLAECLARRGVAK
jgi:hypothetical protein